MPRMTAASLIVTLLLFFAQSAGASEPLPVFVSIVPQKYFLEQIGRELVDVQVMVQPGSSPATYEPKPKQMADLSGAKLYFAIGVPFESSWLPKFTAANPEMTVVHTERGIEKRPMATHPHDGEVEDPGDAARPGDDPGGGEDAPAGSLDPHIWLSPPLVRIQARTICEALTEADPLHGSAYADNCRQFEESLDTLDANLKKIFSEVRGLQFMVFHPAWGYFADAYSLVQVPVEIEGKAPKPAQLTELIRYARKQDIRVIFVQPQFSKKSAELIAREIGGQAAVADPLAEAWMDNLRTLSESFKTALR